MNRTSRLAQNTSRKKPRAEQKAPASPLLRSLRGAAIGNLAAILFGTLLLLLSARIVFSRPDPDALMLPVSLTVLALSSLLCGAVAERASGEAVLPVGAAAGAIWVLVGFLLSLVVGDGAGAISPVYAFALRIPQFLLVLLGAFLTKSRPRKVSSRRRR